MVKQVLEHLADEVRSLNLFERVEPLAELYEGVKQDGTPIKYPAVYTGPAFKQINISDYNGLAYFRKSETVRFEQTTGDEQVLACSTIHDVTIPLKLIASKLRTEITGCEPRYAAEYLAEVLVQGLAGRSKSLQTAAGDGVIQANVNVQSIETNRNRILEEETDGYDTRINDKWVMASLDINVVLRVDNSCLETICYGYGEN